MHGSGNYDRKKKIQSSVWRVRDQLRLEKKKIQSSVCWVRGSGDYEKKKDTLRPEKKDTVVCLMSARFWQLRPEKKKDTVICLLGARFWRLRPEKKEDTVVCLTGCAVVLFFVVAGNFDFDQKKKIQSSVWRVVLYVVSVFGSDGKLAVFFCDVKFSLRPEKKKIQSSVWRVRDQL